jgi:branched-chain amino acid transport system substrate-binding protein
MTKITRRTTLAALGSAIAMPMLRSSAFAQSGPIKIGYAGALTGPAAFTGVDIRRGAELAIADVNSRGGVKGRKLELDARDDEHNPVRTVAQYRELVEREGVVAMVGATNSASMLALAPIVNDTLKVPVIMPASDATAITENDAAKAGRDNFLFRVGMYGTGQGNFMVDTAVKKLGFTKIGLLNWTGGWGVTGRGELNRRLRELGMTPVADETFDSSDTDMTPQIIKLKNAGAQCILNYALVRENTFVVQTKQKLGDTTPYISGWGIAGPAFWVAAGKAAEGVLSSTTITIDGPQSPERVAMLEKYQAMFKAPMEAPWSAFGAYDAILLFAEVMERDGVDREVIRKGLENVPTFKGLIKQFNRPVFTKDRHNAMTEDDMIMCRWTDSKLLEIGYEGGKPVVMIDAQTKRMLDPTDLHLI